MVDLKRSSPTAVLLVAPRIIDRIYYENDQIRYKGRIYDQKDPNNFPSISLEGYLTVLETPISFMYRGEEKSDIHYIWLSEPDFRYCRDEDNNRIVYDEATREYVNAIKLGIKIDQKKSRFK